MSLPNKQTPSDFTFKHSGQADDFGNSKGGDVGAIQSDFDARAIDNQDQINAIIDGLKDATPGQTGAGDIGLNALNVTADNVESGIAENRAAIAETQLGQIADNTITEDKMVFAMKKQAGGVAEFDTVASMQTDVANNKQNLNVSSIFNGLDKDTLDRLTLSRDPQTSIVFNTLLTYSYPAIYNETESVNIPNNLGDFYRVFLVTLRSSSDATKTISCYIDTDASGDRVVYTGVDFNGQYKCTMDTSSLLVNSTDDLGCGTFIADSNKDYAFSLEYNSAGNGGQGTIDFKFAGLGGGGGYPHNYSFYVTLTGVV